MYRDLQKKREWRPLDTPHHEIFLPESTVLIIGLGGIGSETARLCKAIGMQVIGIDARREDKPEWVDDMFGPQSIENQLPKADFVVLTIPHTPETEGFMDSKKFSLMKVTIKRIIELKRNNPKAEDLEIYFSHIFFSISPKISSLRNYYKIE